MKHVEYKVRDVSRFIVTRYERDMVNGVGNIGSSSERGEYHNVDTAYEVAYALCKSEHEQLGYALDDNRIKYPEHPGAVSLLVEQGEV